MHFLLLATLHAMVDIIYAEPKLRRYVVVRTKFLQTSLSWRGCAMFTLPYFGLA